MSHDEIIAQVKGQEIADLASSLIRFESVNPPGKEREIAEFIASWFDKRGFESVLTGEVEGRPNVQVEFRGEVGRGRTLVLNGHMDVVPTGAGWTKDPFGGEIVGTRLYGRGSGDMKGALSAMMVALDVLRKHRRKVSGGIIFQAVVDEEVGSPIGTGHLVKRGVRADFAVVGEPTSLEVCTCHKGIINYEVTTHGKAAHASVPQTGVSAILAMQEVIAGISAYSKSLTRKVRHPLLGSPTVNIGVIEGGTKVNIVPDTCRIVGERRVVPPETADKAASEVQSELSRIAKRKRIKCDVNVFRKIESSEAKGGAGATKALIEAVGEITGRRRKPIGFVATCDAHYLNNMAKIPTVICGPGSLTNIHNADEYVEIKELEQAGRIYTQTFMEHFQR